MDFEVSRPPAISGLLSELPVCGLVNSQLFLPPCLLPAAMMLCHDDLSGTVGPNKRFLLLVAVTGILNGFMI